MTTSPSDGPLIWNVAGLLADAVGSDRQYPVADARPPLPDGLILTAPVAGTVRLSRTNRGVLADADLKATIAGECSRCLKDLSIPLVLGIHEEYLPTVDLASGKPVAVDDEPDALRLTDHHEVDLEPPVVDAIVLAEPIAPLCRPDCPGLCIVCGGPLESGDHDHPDDEIDPRLEALRGFKADGG
jgi:DUF177 domain-containing protein